MTDSDSKPQVIELNDEGAYKSSEDVDYEKSITDNLQLTVVESIRREEFGVGVELSEDGQKLMVKQQERQGRSLNRLSRDLYSKDTHFVLELIQNADDNNYPADMFR